MSYIIGFLSKGVISFMSLFLFFPVFVLAQSLPTGRAISLNEIIDLTQSVGGFLYVIGVVLAAIIIILSGITYIMARGDSGKVKIATDTLRGGLIGAVIIFSFGIIINTLQALVANPSSFFGF